MDYTKGILKTILHIIFISYNSSYWPMVNHDHILHSHLLVKAQVARGVSKIVKSKKSKIEIMSLIIKNDW